MGNNQMVNTPEDDERQQGIEHRPTWFYWFLVILVIVGFSIVYGNYHGGGSQNQQNQQNEGAVLNP